MDSVEGQPKDTIPEQSNEVLFFSNNFLDSQTRDEIIRSIQIQNPDFMSELDKAANRYLAVIDKYPFLDEETKIKIAFIDGALRQPAGELRNSQIFSLEEQINFQSESTIENRHKKNHTFAKQFSKLLVSIGFIKVSEN